VRGCRTSCFCGHDSGFHKLLRKKGFCSGAFFEILSTPHGKRRKPDLHEPFFTEIQQESGKGNNPETMVFTDF